MTAATLAVAALASVAVPAAAAKSSPTSPSAPGWLVEALGWLIVGVAAVVLGFLVTRPRRVRRAAARAGPPAREMKSASQDTSIGQATAQEEDNMTGRWGQEEDEQAAEPGPGEEWSFGDVRLYSDNPPEKVGLRLAEPASPAPSPQLNSAGEYVVSVLAAAEAAAEKLRRDAEREAEQTRERLAAEADELRARIVAETEAQSGEALHRAQAAEAEAAALREGAESFAEQLQREAEETATRIIREAEHRAAALERRAADRERTLLANISASEERMGRLASSLDHVASQLHELAGDRLRLPEQDADRPIGAEREAIARREAGRGWSRERLR